MGKKRKKSSTDNLIISVGLIFTIVLGILRLLNQSGSWIRVFFPLLLALLIVFLINSIKSGVKTSR